MEDITYDNDANFAKRMDIATWNLPETEKTDKVVNTPLLAFAFKRSYKRNAKDL